MVNTSFLHLDIFLFNLCGFDSKTAPGASSYYDFIIRLWQSDRSEHLKRKMFPKMFLSRPRKKLNANKKLPPKHSGSVKKLVQRAINGRLPDINPAKIMQQLLARCVVDQSAEMGILGNTSAVSVAFDGSPYYSGASHYGVKVCDCRSKGIYNCTCPRKYSDPDARWGWDSYREQWFIIARGDISQTLFRYCQVKSVFLHHTFLHIRSCLVGRRE
jgi:hypothetical protein